MAYRHLPVEHQRQLHSTNPLERLNKEIKRRSSPGRELHPGGWEASIQAQALYGVEIGHAAGPLRRDLRRRVANLGLRGMVVPLRLRQR